MNTTTQPQSASARTHALTQPELVLCELATTDVDGLESFSPFCLKTHRALRLAGLRYTSRHADRPSVFKPYNATGQVPVLLVDGRPVSDSTAILRAIEVMVPGALVRGLEGVTRDEAWLWEELADTSLNGFLVAARWADDENWPRVRDAYFGGIPMPVRVVIAGMLRGNIMKALRARDVVRAGPDACWQRYEALLDSLDARAPTTGFWLGGHATLADVALFAQLHGLRNRYTARQGAMIAARSTLNAWLDRVQTATR